MTKVKPIVISDEGELQNIQPGQKLTIQEELDYQRMLIRKLVFILIANGLEVPDEQLLTEIQ